MGTLRESIAKLDEQFPGEVDPDDRFFGVLTRLTDDDTPDAERRRQIVAQKFQENREKFGS